MKKYFKIARYLDFGVALAALAYALYAFMTAQYLYAGLALFSAILGFVCVKYPPGELLAKKYLGHRMPH